jgi:hypothetical protein
MANCFGLRTARLGAACPHGRPRPHSKKSFLRALVDPVGDDIILTDGRKLLSLKDAADYNTKLRKNESALPEWQRRSRH